MPEEGSKKTDRHIYRGKNYVSKFSWNSSKSKKINKNKKKIKYIIVSLTPHNCDNTHFLNKTA